MRLEYLRRFLWGRQYAYKRIFDGEYGREVLADLATFCRAHQSTYDPDPRMSALLDGRREVLLRIMDHINLSPDELYELSVGHSRQQSARLQAAQEGNDE